MLICPKEEVVKTMTKNNMIKLKFSFKSEICRYQNKKNVNFLFIKNKLVTAVYFHSFNEIKSNQIYQF